MRRAGPAHEITIVHVGGHRALGGQPSSTRLQEQSWFALPQVLNHLERYAWYEMGRQVVAGNGCIRLLRRNAYLDLALRGVELALYETLHGLEAKGEGEKRYLLRNYRTFRQVPTYARDKLPSCFSFEQHPDYHSPRIAVAL